MKFTKGQTLVITDTCYDGQDVFEGAFEVLEDFNSAILLDSYLKKNRDPDGFFLYLEKEKIIKKLIVIRADWGDLAH